MQCTTIAVDLSKAVFQLSLADSKHRIVGRRRLSRARFSCFLATTEPCRLVMEARASAHYWARVAEQYGHRVKLLHAHYVRPYVRRSKTDAADADALLQADQDRELRPVPVKNEHQQALQSLHRIRAQWHKTRTARSNCAKALLAEFGVLVPRGGTDLALRLRQATDDLPHPLQQALHCVIDQIVELGNRLDELDRELCLLLKNESDARRLEGISGIGVITATALIGRVADIHAFKRGRAFAGWLGITPREYSSGSCRRLGAISKQDDRYLRTLLIHGARSALRAAARAQANDRPLTRLQRWALDTQQRVGHNKATVALANKMARIVWAVWTKQKTFNGDDALRFAA
jgi:transposase